MSRRNFPGPRIIVVLMLALTPATRGIAAGPAVAEAPGIRLEYLAEVPKEDVAFVLGEASFALTAVSHYLGRPAPAKVEVRLIDQERIPFTDTEKVIWLPYGRLRYRVPGDDPMTLVHEMTHVIATGKLSNRFLTEGLAVHVQTLLGGKAYPNFGKDLHLLTKELEEKNGSSVPILDSEKVRNARDSGQGRALAYVQEGSFARWLIETHGLEKFLRALDGEPAQDVYEAGFEELEADWREMLAGYTEARPPGR